jgi:SAM-dependent methyltransferase
VYGVEPSAHAAQYAQWRFGLDVFQGRLADAHLPSKHFDVITFWDSLEHTFDPLETLREANRLLVDGGVIGMTLPNWDSLDRVFFGREWIGYDAPRHLYVFTQPVLKRMFENAGFRITSTWCSLTGYFTFTASVRLWLKEHMRARWLRQAIAKMMDLPGMRFLFEPFFYLIDQLGRGATLIVLGRKAESAFRG